MCMKKFLKSVAKASANKAFTWFDSYAPKMPSSLKSQIEKEKED